MKKAKTAKGPEIFYNLDEVRACLREGRYRINPDCQEDARYYFGWEEPVVVAALMKLKESMFCGLGNLDSNHCITVAKYRCPNLHKGESVYTHFYILDARHVDEVDTLVVNSFKQL